MSGASFIGGVMTVNQILDYGGHQHLDMNFPFLP